MFKKILFVIVSLIASVAFAIAGQIPFPLSTMPNAYSNAFPSVILNSDFAYALSYTDQAVSAVSNVGIASCTGVSGVSCSTSGSGVSRILTVGIPSSAVLAVSSVVVSGAMSASSVSSTTPIAVTSGGTGVATSTGTGSVVLNNLPTLIGVTVSGVAAATTFSGSGASLTNIPTTAISGTFPATSIAGTTSQVQYIKSTGFMGGDAAFTFNDTTKALSVSTGNSGANGWVIGTPFVSGFSYLHSANTANTGAISATNYVLNTNGLNTILNAINFFIIDINNVDKVTVTTNSVAMSVPLNVTGAVSATTSVTAKSNITLATGRSYNTGTTTDTIAAGIASTYESNNSATITLTLAAPSGDGELRRVCLKNASTVTWAVTSPATAVVGLPTVFIAGQCVEAVYNSAAGTPTNSPATSWVVY